MLTDRVSKRQDAALRMMRETQVRILVIDEVHNILSGSRLQQRRLLIFYAGSATSCRSPSSPLVRPSASRRAER